MFSVTDIPRSGTVYRLHIGGKHYTGSTMTDLRSRIQGHQSACNAGEKTNRKLYQFVRDNGGWDTVRVSVLESGIPDDATLLQREQANILLGDDCLNSYNPVLQPPTPTPRPPVYKKRPEDNHKKVYDRTYYETNAEKLKARRREYYNAAKKDPVKMESINENLKLNRWRRRQQKLSDAPK
jgi:hypothetical protein